MPLVTSQQINHLINTKTKPVGSLGVLEELAHKICLIQDSLTPSLENPHIILFAADHGISRHPVSAYPREVTQQMVLNFLNGGAAINSFSKQHNIELLLVDSGVDYDFPDHRNLINAKIRKGTSDFTQTEAMHENELLLCKTHAQKLITQVADNGCNMIGFGEMGIGNTSSAAILMHKIGNIPLENCTGIGTGISTSAYDRKCSILKNASERHPTPLAPLKALEYYGGFEIAMMTFSMQFAFERNMIILVDGFIASVALFCAYKETPHILNNAIFCHLSPEKGHKYLLHLLNQSPVLNLSMRLGEGTGCAISYPIIESSVNFLNEMASFHDAKISPQI